MVGEIRYRHAVMIGVPPVCVESITWLLLAVVTVAALAVGACALFLPDRPPELLSPARQVTSAPVNTQEYTGSQQVTVVPTVSASRQLLGNATGTVTADWSGSGLTSGRAAYQVNGRAVVALNTAIPLYRDIRPGDVGQDALAVNNELNRLGYSSSPDSTTFTWYTQLGWQQLMIDQGNDSDGTLLLADTLWIPSPSVTVANWSGTVGAMVSAGAPVGEIPGTITRLQRHHRPVRGIGRVIDTGHADHRAARAGRGRHRCR